MELVKPEGKAVVPTPKQYKNVLKLIATVMYMFASIYFLVQTTVEFFRKRYMQALALLMMYLIGSSILYVAYRAVFNAP
jgi:K+-sensing histidine kinase KdpD